MLQITGKEVVLLPHIRKMDVSDISPVGNGTYQRVLRFITDEGVLELSLTADGQTTIAFAADPIPYYGALDEDGEED
jgi:hypothetical protein